MGIREDRIRAINYDHPEYIPISVGFLPRTWSKYREKLEEIILRHPIISPDYENGSVNFDEVGGKYALGKHTDAWGCVANNILQGLDSIVTKHPVPSREAINQLKAPEVDEGIPHGFMFLRLTDLRGFEEAMLDFAEEPPELQTLIDVVLEYNMRQVRIMLEEKKGEEILRFGDDLGMQHALPISPEKWRKYLKPCYAKIYALCHEQGHYVYMHTDGCIHEIIPDLIDCGVNVVNAQFRANGLENLVRACKGKVCLDLDLDRQMFPFCSPGEIDAHVREVVEALGSCEGGLWLEAECGPDVPLENIEAICAALERYRSYFH